MPTFAWVRRPAVQRLPDYLVGTLGAYWTIGTVLAIGLRAKPRTAAAAPVGTSFADAAPRRCRDPSDAA
jgi:hypothetical protein